MIAPASPFDAARLREAEAWLEQRGYKVHYDRTIFAHADYLAGDDARRLKEFHQAWSDPKASAVFVARGGYGCTRIVQDLEERILRRSKKVFMGLSDLTVLLNQVARKAGVVTVHGPVLAGDTFFGPAPETRDRWFRKLENAESTTLREPMDFRTLHPGRARGRLFGGNLSLVQSALGTDYEVPSDGVLLFLEEANEPRYRIDRMFGHLAAAGALRKISGLVLGHFLGPDRTSHELAWLKSVTERYLGERDIPVIGGIHAGHGPNDVLLPIGGECRIDTMKRTFELASLVK